MKRLHATLAFAGAGLVLSNGWAKAGITADSVVGTFTPGNFVPSNTPAAYNNSSAALGTLTGNTGYGGLNPFNPPYSATQIVAIGAGGELTLHLSSPAPVSSSPTIGVFSNNGMVDVSSDGSGVAGSPATTFDDPVFPEAIVSVSSNGTSYVALNGGSPIVFSNPTNYYTDQSISGYYEPLGSAIANQYKPFTGTLASFSGETFSQIETTLGGSAGGTWLSLSGTGLSSVSDVRFDVPANATYAMFVDSVSAVPEPVTALPIALGSLLLSRRRRRK